MPAQCILTNDFFVTGHLVLYITVVNLCLEGTPERKL